MEAKKSFVGVDVSKDRLDVAAWPEEKRWSVKTGAEEMERLVEQFSALRPEVVVMEATGGLEMRLVPPTAGLDAAAVPLAIVNSRHGGMRDFARSHGWLAKTGRIDAMALAQFAESHRIKPRQGRGFPTRRSAS